ncbi:hypothetical protein IHQ71_11805 [Rhizobium sp. TH2]|uniref:hypothetical protein n=1 Tax=Rhizobium sp. TH2 TaxID=2775403 RepID=UPI0021585245|nr:hypothetical protein [Rhizobium sp. TH2]UVC11192.1 hypothetical protein IHQ71_11805 [Rhizobium sp. TH2]
MIALPDGNSAEKVLAELRGTCLEIRRLVRTQSPKALIGYLWAQVLMSLLGKSSSSPKKAQLPNVSTDENTIMFAMEYIHATVVVDGLAETENKVDEAIAKQIVDLSEKAKGLCFQYAMVDTALDASALPTVDKKLAFQILTNWILIRGRRFQVLEQEFFSYVLAPHNDQIQSTYGISSFELANEIQKVADAIRAGFDKAQTRMMQIFLEIRSGIGKNGIDMQAAIESANKKKPELAGELKAIFDDLFLGGLFNVTKHSSIPQKLLEDLSFQPGENSDFDKGSKIGGTPFMTLPARVKPFIKLGADYYCTDPNFVRDASYRAIQRALVTRKPTYREEWNKRQKRMSEDAFADIMAAHLKGARVFKDVYYPIGKNQWAETDCVILINDVLINVEAKAGAEALSAPAENLARHVKQIEELIESAYRQTKRFLDYVHQKPEAPIYRRLPDGKHEEIARIRHSELRHVFPIGLTVEAFTPFSSSIKENASVVAIADRYDFISISMDDLLVVRRILSGTGEFLHYLAVRQGLAGIKNAMLFDEMDHLGAYISQNRADLRIKEMLSEHEADYLWLDGMDQDIIGPYFSDADWPNAKKPKQDYPPIVLELLEALELAAAPLWLAADEFIRDLDDVGRRQIQDSFERALPNLRAKPFTYFATSGDAGAVFGVIREDARNARRDLIFETEALAMALREDRVRLIEIGVNSRGKITSAHMSFVKRPSMLRSDFASLSAEAVRLEGKFIRAETRK